MRVLFFTYFFLHSWFAGVVCANTKVIELSPICIKANKKHKSLTVKTLKTASKGSHIGDVLKSNNAVVLSSQGGIDAISLRGVMQDNLQIWIDGMPFQNSVTPSFNLAQIQTQENQTLSIESGPLSAKRGMNSFLGVVDLRTEEASKATSVSTFCEIGRYNTFKYGGSVSGKIKNTSGTIQASRFTNNGNVSFASRMSENNPTLKQGDFIKQNNLVTRIDHQNDDWQLTLFGRSGNSDMSYKSLPGSGPIDYRAKESYQFVRTVLKKKTGFWQPEVGIGQANFKRKDYTQISNMNDRKDFSTVNYLNFDNIVNVTKDYQIHANTSFLLEHYKNVTTKGGGTSHKKNRIFFNVGNVIHLKDTLIELWAAIDGVRGTKSNVDFQALLQHKICSCLTGIISGGTASRNPSLSQLFDTSSGNKNLLQEKAFGGDIGFQYKTHNHQINQNYFHYNIKDKISGIVNSQGRTAYANQDFVKMYGLDTMYQYKYKQWKLGLEHLYARTRDHKGRRLLKVPTHKIMASVAMDFLSDLGDIKVTCNHMGGFVDQEYQSPQKRRPNVTTVDIESTYNMSSTVSLYGVVENVFNEQYEFPITYKAGGINISVGMKIKL